MSTSTTTTTSVARIPNNILSLFERDIVEEIKLKAFAFLSVHDFLQLKLLNKFYKKWINSHLIHFVREWAVQQKTCKKSATFPHSLVYSFFEPSNGFASDLCQFRVNDRNMYQFEDIQKFDGMQRVLNHFALKICKVQLRYEKALAYFWRYDDANAWKFFEQGISHGHWQSAKKCLSFTLYRFYAILKVVVPEKIYSVMSQILEIMDQNFAPLPWNQILLENGSRKQWNTALLQSDVALLRKICWTLYYRCKCDLIRSKCWIIIHAGDSLRDQYHMEVEPKLWEDLLQILQTQDITLYKWFSTHFAVYKYPNIFKVKDHEIVEMKQLLQLYPVKYICALIGNSFGKREYPSISFEDCQYYLLLGCQQKYPLALFNSGLVLKDGRGDFEKNTQKRFLYYYEAANRGHATAMNNTAVCYQNGVGHEKDMEMALYWYKRAAKLGVPHAFYNLGLIYRKGEGVTKNYEYAVECFRNAGFLGHMTGSFYLGRHYEKGKGVTRDLQMAAKYYKSAADSGEKSAQLRLAKMYLEGKGVEQNEKEAVNLLRLAASQGSSTAQHILDTLQGVKSHRSSRNYSHNE